MGVGNEDSVINSLPVGIRDMARELDAYFVSYDFDDNSMVPNKKNILLSLRNQLRQYGVFEFNLFDAAILDCSKKQGIDINNDETTSQIISQNDWINAAVSGLGAIPVIGVASNLLQSIDIVVAKVKDGSKKKEIKKKYGKELSEIISSTPNEILNNLHKYFIADMRENMLERVDKPLVVFFDTYEKYINSLNSDTLSLINDYWLRKDRDCVIKNIPGIMWVILGREKLTWKGDDPDWQDDEMPEHPFSEMTEEEKTQLSYSLLEEHLVGDLSQKDTYFYLEKVGIHDESLKSQLYDLTKGTPLFLDMCSRHYDTIKDKGDVDISDFGKDLTELITRYLSNMPSHYREMSYFLAGLDEWTDEIVQDIVPNVKFVKEFTEARYNDYKKLSFIVKNEETYKIHDTVKRAFASKMPVELKKEMAEVLVEYYKKQVNQKKDSLEYPDAFSRYVLSVVRKCDSLDELYLYWESIYDGLSNLYGLGLYAEYLGATKILYEFAKGKSNDSSEIKCLLDCFYADAMCFSGFVKEAYELIANYVDVRYAGEINKTDYLELQRCISVILCAAGLYKEASNHITELLENEIEECDKKKWVYRGLLSVQGNAFYGLGDFKKALEINEQVYEIRRKVLGEQHPDTVSSLYNVGVDYSKLGDYKKALEIAEQVYGIRREVLGEEHPGTIRCLKLIKMLEGRL